MRPRDAIWMVVAVALVYQYHQVAGSGSQPFSRQKIAYYRERVRSMFYHAYNGYLNHAFPFDELMPITCRGMDTWGSYSLTLVDALDTLLIMGNHTEFERASQLVIDTIDYNANVNVSVFETNIRVIGGLISAHMLSGISGSLLEDGWPCSGPLLTLAERLANKLLPAFNTWTGMPYGTVNLRHGVHKLETPITCTAGVGTFLLEFGTLSRLTGNPHYERVALKALSELWRLRSGLGLVGNHINVQTGQWTAKDAGIGAGVDSYFEYLVKGSILLNRPDLMRQFNHYKRSIKEYIQHDDWFFWVSMTKGHVTMPVFQSLEQFWPGILTLIGDTDEAMRILTNYHKILKQYGFSPEFYNVPTMESVTKRSGYPLRPELIESLFYTYQATRDPLLLQIGAEAIEAIEHSAKTPCGYATVVNVRDHKIEDRMESFFLSETTKYLYLLFDPDNFIHNPGFSGQVHDTTSGTCVINTGGYIFNTEAHPVDPSIVYCCSARRQKDIGIVEEFQNKLDLLSLLGLDNDDDDAFELEFPQGEMPPVMYMPEEFEYISKRNRSGLLPPDGPAENESVGSIDTDDVEVGREDVEKNNNMGRSPELLHPAQSAHGKRENVGNRKTNMGDKKELSMMDGLPGAQAQIVNKPAASPQAVNSPSAVGGHERSQEESPRLATSLKRTGVPTSAPPSRGEKEMVATTILSDFLDGVSTLSRINNDIKKLDKQRDDDCSVGNEKKDCSRQVCRIYEQYSSSVSFNRLLRLMYAKGSDAAVPLTKLNPDPVCLPSEGPKEADNYMRVPPNTTSYIELEELDRIDDGTISSLSLGNLPTSTLRKYHYKLMSCRSRTLKSRLFALGQIMHSRKGG